MKQTAGSVRGELTLVGLLGSLGALALDGLGDVVGGVGDRVGDLTDDALVRLVNVGSRHVDGWLVVGKGWKRGDCLDWIGSEVGCCDDER